MTRRLGIGLLVGVLAATVVVDAQFGGLIKRAGEAIKKPTPPPDPPSAATPPASGLSCSVDDAAMDRLTKALEAQRAAQDAALKNAEGKTQAAYDACQLQFAQSPEAQRLFQGMALPENATPAQSQAAMEKFATTMTKMLADKCGPTPTEVREQLETAFKNAAKMSDCDAKIQEHAYRFCQLTPAEQKAAQNGGIRVPGTGAKIFWVYTEAEARAYAPRCGQLMSLMDAIYAQNQQASKQ